MIKIPPSLTIYKGGRRYKGQAPLPLIDPKMVKAKLKSIAKFLENCKDKTEIERYKTEAKQYENLFAKLPKEEPEKPVKKKSK